MSELPATPVPPHTLRTVDETTVVTLYGEIDLVTAIPLVSGLDALTAGMYPDLVLDLRAVSFIDCAGLRVLCRTRNRVRARSGRLRLITGSADFLRILRATALTGVFDLLPRLPEALTSASTPDVVLAAMG
ncbi:STAS domain-containing protein [Streptomyces sp. NPDC057062]|uniref:STAS domain-containing protein n=1 Tax=Streptomyces sp. NPDC057062 TaxID=3346011 RepID=UPI00362806B9